jgi:O-antigen/teichoic acid export membrane protein
LLIKINKLKLNNNITKLIGGKLVRNSTWGVSSSIIQNLLYSVFFMIVARNYKIDEFSSYVIANNIYGLLLSFSAMGLGQWFIRSIIQSEEEIIIQKFFKIQVILGVIFYFLNITATIFLYADKTIRILSLIMGINIIFDNIIYVIKHINIKNYDQNKSFFINIIDASLKFVLAIIILFINIPIELLALLIISIRFLTLNLFIKYGTSNKLNFKLIVNQKIKIKEILKLITDNYSFVIIGSISVLFWGLGGIFVSKFLSLKDVGDYEVSFKIFSMAEIIPVIVSSSIYPMLINLEKENKVSKVNLFKIATLIYSLYGLMSYTFILSYGNQIIPFLFGEKYMNTHIICQDMFLTMIIFPTGVLQANMLISMNQEKVDMKLNLVSLISNIILSVIGIKLIGSINAINHSILISFGIFHVLQNIYLVKKKEITKFFVFSNYSILVIIFSVFNLLKYYISSNILYAYFWGTIFVLVAVIIKYVTNNQDYKNSVFQKVKY